MCMAYPKCLAFKKFWRQFEIELWTWPQHAALAPVFKIDVFGVCSDAGNGFQRAFSLDKPQDALQRLSQLFPCTDGKTEAGRLQRLPLISEESNGRGWNWRTAKSLLGTLFPNICPCLFLQYFFYSKRKEMTDGSHLSHFQSRLCCLYQPLIYISAPKPIKLTWMLNVAAPGILHCRFGWLILGCEWRLCL